MKKERMVALEGTFQALTEQLREMQSEAAIIQQMAESLIDKEDALNITSFDLDTRTQAVERKELDLAEREQRLVVSSQALEGREASLKLKESGLDQLKVRLAAKAHEQESRAQELQNLAAKEKDIQSRESTLIEAAKVDRQRKELLDARETALAKEVERISRISQMME